MTDFEDLYQQKCIEFEELNEQFLAYQQQSTMMIEQIEKENEDLKSKNRTIQEQLDSLKEKRKNQTVNLEKQLELIKRERNQFKNKFEDFNRKVVDLENINQTLESQNRAANSMLKQYQQRVEKTMEELALLQIQLEESKSSNQEQMTRLKNQLKQTQEELYVLHLKHQKHNDQSQQRRSRLSSSASFSSQEDISRIISPVQVQQKNDTNLASILSMDFKRNKQANFSKTICLVKNLINEIDDRAKRLKGKKKISNGAA